MAGLQARAARIPEIPVAGRDCSVTRLTELVDEQVSHLCVIVDDEYDGSRVVRTIGDEVVVSCRLLRHTRSLGKARARAQIVETVGNLPSEDARRFRSIQTGVSDRVAFAVHRIECERCRPNGPASRSRATARPGLDPHALPSHRGNMPEHRGEWHNSCTRQWHEVWTAGPIKDQGRVLQSNPTISAVIGRDPPRTSTPVLRTIPPPAVNSSQMK